MNSKKNFFIVFLSGLAVLIAASLALVAIFSPSDTATGDRIADQSERVVTNKGQQTTAVANETPKTPSDDPAANGNAPIAPIEPQPGETVRVLEPITIDGDLSNTPGFTGVIYVYMEADLSAIEITPSGYSTLLRQHGLSEIDAIEVYLTRQAAESVGYSSALPSKSFILKVKGN